MTKIREINIKIEDKNLRAVEVNGSEDGPRLAITTGVHGCEYVGIQAVKEFIKEVGDLKFKGSLLIVPLVNESGFVHGLKRIVKEDGQNLNRCFPGDKEGSFTYKLAQKIEEEIYKDADFLIDLHGGDINEIMTPLVFYPVAADQATNKKAKKLAEKLTTNYMVPSISKNGLYSWANQNKIPSLLLERGSLGRWTRQEVDLVKRNILEIMAGLGMVEYEESIGPIEIKEASYIEARSTGYWYPQLEINQPFKKGQVLGILEDENSKPIQEVKSNYDGIILYQTLSLGVKRDDPLIAYGRI